jgi:hypothetical protein
MVQRTPADATHVTEEPQCQSGVNNDFQTGIDFDGGLSVWGAQVDQPDPQCVGRPWKNRETTGCGLGYEVAPFMLVLGWLCWARQRRQ